MNKLTSQSISQLSNSPDFTPYEWKEGDVITSEKLNALENLKTAYSEQASAIEGMSGQLTEMIPKKEVVKLNSLKEIFFYPSLQKDESNFFVPSYYGSLPLLSEEWYGFSIYYAVDSTFVRYRSYTLNRGENGVYVGGAKDSRISDCMGVVTYTPGANTLNLSLYEKGGWIMPGSKILAVSIKSDNPLFSDVSDDEEVCFVPPYDTNFVYESLSSEISSPFLSFSENYHYFQFTSFPTLCVRDLLSYSVES